MRGAVVSGEVAVVLCAGCDESGMRLERSGRACGEVLQSNDSEQSFDGDGWIDDSQHPIAGAEIVVGEDQGRESR